jgi:hypothetical protein
VRAFTINGTLFAYCYVAALRPISAEMQDPVKDKLRRFELLERFGNFYPTIGSAVDAYLEEHAVGWKP